MESSDTNELAIIAITPNTINLFLCNKLPNDNTFLYKLWTDKNIVEKNVCQSE